MKIDFTALDNIRRQKPADNTARSAPAGQDTEINFAALDSLKCDQPADKSAESNNRAYSLLDTEVREREHMRQMYADHQQAIRQAQALTAEIMHGMAAGQEPTALLLQAIRAISLMTGDRALYDTAQAQVQTVYGYGLNDTGALAGELAAAQDRLARLERAQQSNSLPADGKQRLQAAIRAHRADIAQLKLKLAG